MLDVVNPVAQEETSPLLFLHSPQGLVAAHHALCGRAARKFCRPGLERCDLEQVAALGLMKAAHRFNPAAHTPFEAYAWITIIGELMHHVRDHERLVRIPRRLRALEASFSQTRECLVARFGREPSDGELADAMGVLRTTLAELRAARHATVTIAIDETDASLFLDPVDLSAEDRLLVKISFASLPEIERRVIAGVYLLGLTQHDLARILEISAKRVSRLHRSALARMKRAWIS